MPWYKAGTVSVVQNSNAVIGTNTAFIANARVGDGFRGPDGRWYEITNIASDSALSIDPPYEGASNGTGVYALVPVQGYPKALADAFNNLNAQFGPQLAALGTTGNYEILPVSKGGTGGVTPAEARDGLELVKMSSKTDATQGRVITVDDFGIGAPIGLSGAAADANNIQSFGWYYLQGATNTPTPNGWLSVQPVTPAYCAQEFVSETDGRRYSRTKRTNWDAWAPAAKGGANSDITSLSGLTTPLSVAQGGTGGDFWAVQPIGMPLPLLTNLAGVTAPPTNKDYRYVLLSAASSYNTGVLGSESTTGSWPLVNSTGVITLAGSPMNGATVRLINTELRVLRASEVAGAAIQDAMESHTHYRNGTSAQELSLLISGGVYSEPGGGGVRGISTPLVTGGAASGRTDGETRAKSLSVVYYMRVK